MQNSTNMRILELLRFLYERSSFLDALNSAIDELRADGTLKELSEKYFGQDISSEN